MSEARETRRLHKRFQTKTFRFNQFGFDEFAYGYAFFSQNSERSKEGFGLFPGKIFFSKPMTQRKSIDLQGGI
jgi:hypothetical protein